VPAGSYLVVGYAFVFNSDGSAQDAVCTLQGAVVAQDGLDSSEGVNVPIMGTVTLAAPGTITINCGGFKILTDYKRMFVTKVSAIISG
jgi:hypothetical protein